MIAAIFLITKDVSVFGRASYPLIILIFKKLLAIITIYL